MSRFEGAQLEGWLEGDMHGVGDLSSEEVHNSMGRKAIHVKPCQ